MATLCLSGRIDQSAVELEISRLSALWSGSEGANARDHGQLDELLDAGQVRRLDPFDRVQLEYVVAVCRRSRSLSEAGRVLFENSRQLRKSTNDADRLRKYLARFDLDWNRISRN